MASEVELVTPEGIVHAVAELFPFGGDSDKPKVKCIALQPENGGAARRVKAEGPEADALRKRYPDLKELEFPEDAA